MPTPVPTIVFEVDLELLSTEAIGPKTNLVNPHMLHPTTHQDSPDNGLVEKSNFKNTRSTWNPSFLSAENRALKHGDQFTEYGQKAIYLRDTYGQGYAPNDRACLKIISVS